MDDVQVDDLKQFIVATSSQLEERLTVRIDGLEQRFDGLQGRFDGLEQKVDRLEQKVDDGFAGVGEAVATIHDMIEANQTDTAQRLAKLEQRAA